jgi:vancomycin resistance protein YoaR
VRLRKILVTLGICSSIGVGAGALAHRFVPESPVVRGLLIGDRFVPQRGSPAAWLAARRDEARNRVVRFQYDDQSFESTLGEAGVEIDVAATLQRAEAIGHQGSFTRRLHEASQARAGKIDIPLVWFINKARAKALMERIAERINRPPVDAKLDIENRTKVPDVLGRALDIDAAIQALAEGKHHDEEAIYLPVRYVTAKTTIDDLVQVDIEKVVSASETTFTTWGTGAGRAVNIRNAAAKIDGTILAPGAIFSFNDTVGPRTRERGFTLAPEIQGDELLPGIGGGTCQVSSTLHVAAVYGALEIVDRQSHSKPSSYTQLGLDATVSYPLVDLKIKNSLPYPIMIHAYLPKPTAVRVEILGGDPIAKVSYTYAVSRKEDFMRRIVVKPHFEAGRRRLHQKGSRGYDVTSIVTLQFNDGHQDRRHYFSGYRPFPEIYWVAPGYDEAELPPLPEHAKGVEGQEAPEMAENDAASYPM